MRFQSWILVNVEYIFIIITLRSPQLGVLVPFGVLSIGQIELFNLLFRIIINIKYNY